MEGCDGPFETGLITWMQTLERLINFPREWAPFLPKPCCFPEGKTYSVEMIVRLTERRTSNFDNPLIVQGKIPNISMTLACQTWGWLFSLFYFIRNRIFFCCGLSVGQIKPWTLNCGDHFSLCPYRPNTWSKNHKNNRQRNRSWKQSLEAAPVMD